MVAPKEINEILMMSTQRSPPRHQPDASPPGTNIAFSEEDPILKHCNGEDPLIIKAEIGRSAIHRVYVDGGSSTEIMEREPEEATTPASPENESEKEKMELNPLYPYQKFMIGTSLPLKLKEELKKLLRANHDMFAWSPLDMTRIPRELAEHRLNIHPRTFPVRQKKSVLAQERNDAINQEVTRLVEARILREVYFPRWVANPVLPPPYMKNRLQREKKGKQETLLIIAVPKSSSQTIFMAWMMPKRSGQPFKTGLVKAWEKGYDRFQKQLSQLDALGARYIQNTSSSSHQSENVAFLITSKASSSKHKPSHSSGSYSSYTTSSSKATPTATPGLADEVIHSFLATNADDVDLIHEDLDQIDDLDLEEMDINWQIAMTAIKIKKFYKKTGRRPRVDGKMHVAFDKRKEAGKGQNFKPVQIENEALMTVDEGQINWVEQTTD
ncbi:hypothetical protein Tco_1123872 [Tanacetum coccineum]|uniref:Reverse transcriptase domain-containing protein n=1 Tax=Tanacetum coccineum TaxID=301880 RepID=A0ABQ5J7E7_9ASTR